MARPLRIEYPGAIYHVLSRGDRREAIFRHDADRKLFLEPASKKGSEPSIDTKDEAEHSLV